MPHKRKLEHRASKIPSRLYQPALSVPKHHIVHMRAQHKVDMRRQLVVHRHYWAPSTQWLWRKTMEWFVTLEDWDQWLVYTMEAEWVRDGTRSLGEYNEVKRTKGLPKTPPKASLIKGEELFIVPARFLHENFTPWPLVKPYKIPYLTAKSTFWNLPGWPIKTTVMWDVQPSSLKGKR